MNCIPDEYAAGSYYGIFAPVPIGIITFALVVFLSVFSIKEKILAISVEVLTLVFVLMLPLMIRYLHLKTVLLHRLLYKEGKMNYICSIF